MNDKSEIAENEAMIEYENLCEKLRQSQKLTSFETNKFFAFFSGRKRKFNGRRIPMIYLETIVKEYKAYNKRDFIFTHESGNYYVAQVVETGDDKFSVDFFLNPEL